MLKDYFRLKENGTSVRTEALAGAFATMAYIGSMCSRYCSLRATRYPGSIKFDNDRGIELT